MTPAPSPTPKTRWNVVLLAVGAGIVGAALIGKVPPALPALRAELGMDLVEAGWLASLLSGMGALFGVVVGLAADRIGRRRAMLGGLVVMAAGSLAGAFAESVPLLFAARFLEGAGFVVAVVAAPSVILEAASPKDQRLAFGLWGSYMPTGMTLAMVLAPQGLAAIGWQGLWAAAALPAFAVVAGLWLALRGMPHTAAPARTLKDVPEALGAVGPWLLALAFGFYAFQWFIVMTWLPTFLVETLGQGAQAAGLLTALVVFVNAPGNLMGGYLLTRGAKRWALIALVAAIQAASMQLAFLDGLPLGLRYGAVLVFSFGCGMLPASVFAGVPALAPRPASIGIVNGLIVQGSNLGSFLGAPVYAALVLALGGWDKGALVLLAAAAVVFSLALALRRLERRS